jgi:hypothetical protein
MAGHNHFFEVFMSFQKDNCGGALVDFAGFYADKAVFNVVYATNPVSARDFVEGFYEFEGFHFFAVNRDRNTRLELDGYVFGRVGRFFRSNRPLISFCRGLLAGVFKQPAFDGSAPDAGVDAEFFCCGGDGDVFGFGVLDFFVAG